MLVSNVHINSYKSIHKLSLTLDKNITVLIGPNESGKSNILKAIEAFKPQQNLTPDLTCQFSPFYQENKPPQISLELTNFTRKEKNQFAKIFEGFKDTDSLILRREGPNPNDYKIQSNSKVHSVGNITPLLSFLPKIFYFDSIPIIKDRISEDELLRSDNNNRTEKNLLKIGEIEDIPLLFEDSTKGRRAAEEASKKITIKINDVWSQEPSLEIKLRVNRNFLYIDFSDATTVYDTPKTRSRGFLWYLSFYINFLAESLTSKSNEFLFLLDEPGVHIHPSGQKDMTLLLENLSQKNQLIYSTHSPFMINRDHPERVTMVVKDENGTKVDNESYRENWKPLRDSIGLTVGDLFFFSNKGIFLDLPNKKSGSFFNKFTK